MKKETKQYNPDYGNKQKRLDGKVCTDLLKSYSMEEGFAQERLRKQMLAIKSRQKDGDS